MRSGLVSGTKIEKGQRQHAGPFLYGVPRGVRTPVTAVKGRCPRPLDDGDLKRCFVTGGARRDRTADLLHAMQALSQLSYSPESKRILYGFQISLSTNTFKT